MGSTRTRVSDGLRPWYRNLERSKLIVCRLLVTRYSYTMSLMSIGKSRNANDSSAGVVACFKAGFGEEVDLIVDIVRVVVVVEVEPK